MITLGLVLLLIGMLLDVALLYSAGSLLLLVGLVLFIAGRLGHAIGGRAHYY